MMDKTIKAWHHVSLQKQCFVNKTKQNSSLMIGNLQAVTNLISCLIASGNRKFPLGILKVLCPNGQLKSKKGTECELKSCHYFWDFSTDVYGISFQNRLKVTPLTSFLDGMFPRDGV